MPTSKRRTATSDDQPVRVQRPATLDDVEALAERIDAQGQVVARLAEVVDRLAGRLL